MHPTVKAARIAGAIYLSTLPLALYFWSYVPGKLIVRGNATATADNILTHGDNYIDEIFHVFGTMPEIRCFPNARWIEITDPIIEMRTIRDGEPQKIRNVATGTSPKDESGWSRLKTTTCAIATIANEIQKRKANRAAGTASTINDPTAVSNAALVMLTFNKEKTTKRVISS